MSLHLQLYFDRAFAIGCDSALEMHAADVLPVANDGYTMIFLPPAPDGFGFPAGAAFSQNLTILVSDPLFYR